MEKTESEQSMSVTSYCSECDEDYSDQVEPREFCSDCGMPDCPYEAAGRWLREGIAGENCKRCGGLLITEAQRDAIAEAEWMETKGK